MYSDVIALLDRERAEVERLKEVVSFLQRQCNEAYRQGRESIRTASETSYYRRAEHYRSRMEYFRGRVTKAIQWFRKQREENIRLQNERDSLRLEVQKLNKLYADSRNQWYKADQQRDAAVKQLELSQATVIQIDALRALFGPRPASEVYAAQSELELLRVIRKSQGEGITKLRKEKDELLKRIEHDATVIKRIGDEKVYLEQAVEMLHSDLNNAREATNIGAIRYCDVRKELAQVYQKTDCLQRALNVSQAINRIIDRRARTDGPPVVVKPDCGCQFGVTVCPECDGKYVVYSNPVEAMKANPRLAMMLDEDRRAYNRNVDNQKAYEAPNCPSS